MRLRTAAKHQLLSKIMKSHERVSTGTTLNCVYFRNECVHNVFLLSLGSWLGIFIHWYCYSWWMSWGSRIGWSATMTEARDGVLSFSHHELTSWWMTSGCGWTPLASVPTEWLKPLMVKFWSCFTSSPVLVNLWRNGKMSCWILILRIDIQVTGWISQRLFLCYKNETWRQLETYTLVN